MRDLTDYTLPALDHYKRLGLDFECIYSGFLSSAEQIDHCISFIQAFPNALAVVDPVMGDHGRLYRTCTSDIRAGMGRLVSMAQVITPNLTEAFLLLGKEYDHSPLTSGAAKSMLARLSEQGPNRVVITGVTLATGEYANIGYDREHNAYWKTSGDYVPASYPGTGDIFASVLTGSFMMGDSLPMALDRATRYTELTIKTTFGFSTDSREGVMLERTLEWLTHREVPQRYRPL
jgi:pyridoxine kinase